MLGLARIGMALLGAFAAPVALAAAACQPPRESLSEAQRKFHPGHYVAVGRAELRKGVDTAFGKGVTGLQLRYRWAELEPAKGQYDFAPIARDLDLAKRANLQLVVMIEDKSFRDESPTPAYMQGTYTLHGKRGYTAVRWDPYVTGRMNELVAALGAKFDCAPNFEGVAFQETALGVDEGALAARGYSPEKYRDAQIRLLRASAASLPRSRVFWYMNFLPGRQEYLGEIATAVVGLGVVMGGPDILPENQALERRVYPLYARFNGRLKLFGSMQHDSYRHRRTAAGPSVAGYWPMEDLLAFARDKLHVDYVFWEYRSTRQPADSQNFADARAVIARHPQL